MINFLLLFFERQKDKALIPKCPPQAGWGQAEAGSKKSSQLFCMVTSMNHHY